MLGLGTFGSRLLQKLSDAEDLRLFALDRQQEQVEKAVNLVHTAACGDLDDPEILPAFLDQVGTVDIAVISLGEGTTASISAVLELQDRKVDRVLVKARNESHRRVLKTLERSFAHTKVEVLLPELDAAEKLARSLSAEALTREIQLAPGFSLVEIRWPEKFSGKSLQELELRQNFGLSLLGWRQPGGHLQLAGPESRLEAGALALLVGPTEAIDPWLKPDGP